jgi:threonine dehydratase
MTDVADPVTLANIEAARELLRGVVRFTPLESSRPLSELLDGPVFFKCENLQRTGSFKIRGAYTRIAALSAEQRAAGVVTASAGNHAQGVALAAQLLGTKATVFMPQGASLPKLEATRGYGAHVRMVGHTIDECLTAALEYASSTGATIIHPFDHPDIIAGQGTIGAEILEQCPEVRTIVVSIGGGGLIAGIARAVKSVRPDMRIVGVQAEAAATYPSSLAAGHPMRCDITSTIADGIAVGRPGDLPFELVQRYVDDIVTVSEESISRALLLCLERVKLAVEPAGAASVAALMDAPRTFETPAVAVLSGGNIDPILLLRVLRHGLAASGRYLAFRVRVPDRPGALAKLLSIVAGAEANVLDVGHARLDAKLHIDEVEIVLQLETRGQEHSAEVVATLEKSGYRLLFG